MTRNLSPKRETLGEPVPRSCPKCGATLTGPNDFRVHVRNMHRAGIGIAVPKAFPEADAREFLYIAPAYLRGGWSIVWLDWPFEAATLHRDRYIVEWVHPVGPGKEQP